MAKGRGNVLKILARRRKTVRTMAIVDLIVASMDTVNVRKQAGAELGKAQLKLRLGFTKLVRLA